MKILSTFLLPSVETILLYFNIIIIILLLYYVVLLLCMSDDSTAAFLYDFNTLSIVHVDSFVHVLCVFLD